MAVLGQAPEPVTGEQVPALRELHSEVWPLVHASRYNELAPLVADLIPKLEQAVRGQATTGRA